MAVGNAPAPWMLDGNLPATLIEDMAKDRPVLPRYRTSASVGGTQVL